MEFRTQDPVQQNHESLCPIVIDKGAYKIFATGFGEFFYKFSSWFNEYLNDVWMSHLCSYTVVSIYTVYIYIHTLHKVFALQNNCICSKSHQGKQEKFHLTVKACHLLFALLNILLSKIQRY